MRKSTNRTNNIKENYAREILEERGFIRSSNARIKWCKNYLNRSNRRKNKQKYKEEDSLVINQFL